MAVQYTLRAIPVGGFVSFPNNYEVDEEGVVTEFDDPDLLSNRQEGDRGEFKHRGGVYEYHNANYGDFDVMSPVENAVLVENFSTLSTYLC